MSLYDLLQTLHDGIIVLLLLLFLRTSLQLEPFDKDVNIL